MTRAKIESLADRAAQDGEHAIVAACQVLLRSTSSEDERREAKPVVAEYLREISGY